MVEVRTLDFSPRAVSALWSLLITLGHKGGKNTHRAQVRIKEEDNGRREKGNLATYLYPPNSTRLTTGSSFSMLPLRRHACCENRLT